MARVLWLLVSVFASAGCLTSEVVTCSDGRTCPPDTICDDGSTACLTPAQTTVCTELGIADGKPCSAAGTPGICQRELCLPGCGDAVTDPNEQCDDGNFASHDGCSSRCMVEVPTWVPIDPLWTGIANHSAAYHAALGRMVVLGGLGAGGLRDDIWQYDPAKLDAIQRGWTNVTAAFAAPDRPAPRYGASMAYDPVREVIVLYGGANLEGVITYLGDTWEYAATATTLDGEPIGRWTKVPATTSPSPRFGAALAYDETLDTLVLFGGLDGTAWQTDTWTYNGSWTKLTPQASPSTAIRPGMAYDSTRARLVLLGAAPFGAVWEFDGATWTASTPTPGPDTRRSASLVYDPTRAALVMFGGSIGSTSTVAGDTWIYDGTWQAVPTPAAPPARRAATLVRDPVNDTLVLVGGSLLEAMGAYDDVWHLDSSGWIQRNPRFTPPPSVSSASLYSPEDEAIVLVGGLTSPHEHLYEAWQFDGRRWRQRADAPVARYGHGLVYEPARDRFVLAGGACNETPGDGCDDLTALSGSTFAIERASRTWTTLAATLPAARLDLAMVYDERQDKSVVFGGLDAAGGFPTDTWLFDGTTWSSPATALHPAGTPHPAAGWDPQRQAVIVFDLDGVTWEWTDNEWRVLIPASDTTPPGRRNGAMTYDPLRNRFVLAAGIDASGGSLTDVWELDPAVPAWTELFVSGVGPLPRRDFAFGYHPRARAVVLFSGASASGFAQEDTWLLQYRSATPDEVCGDDADDDDDAQPDSEDPDCDPPPPPP